jgi:hypothetical protein
MAVTARARLFLARHRWVRWTAVAILAGSSALTVHDRLRALELARREWAERRTVLVAETDLDPDDEVRAAPIDLPVAAVPPSALASLPAGARLRQPVAAGEILVERDVTTVSGPAARARPGTAVVAFRRELAAGATSGVLVRIVAEGVVLAEEGRVVALADDLAYVAVPAERAPAVAAANQAGLASLLFLP